MEEAARRISGEKPELAVHLVTGETLLPQLERFRLVGPRMEVVLLVLPLALLVFLLLDWLAGWNTFATDAMRLPALVVLAAVLLILRALFLTTPRAFRSLWLQGVIRSAQDDQPVEVALVDFLDQFWKLLYSRWAWLVGALFVLASYFVTYSGLVLLGLAESGNSSAELFMIFFVYRNNSHIPTWPLNWGLIRRFAAAEAVPLLSLLGTSEQFQALVGPLVNLFQN